LSHIDHVAQAKRKRGAFPPLFDYNDPSAPAQIFFKYELFPIADDISREPPGAVSIEFL
jgi:hypothetical protein